MKKELLALSFFYWIRRVSGLMGVDVLASDAVNGGNEISGISLLTDAQTSLLATQKCDAHSEQLVNKCLQPILAYASSIQDETDGAHLGLQGGEIFHKLCILYHQFKECARSTVCASISMRAVDASYGFMCGDGYKLFEEHATCFAEVENQPEYTHCKHGAGSAMDEATALKRTDMDAFFRRLCLIMNDYLRCCRPFVNKKCGAAAWQLVAQITMDSLEVTMPNCDINSVL